MTGGAYGAEAYGGGEYAGGGYGGAGGASFAGSRGRGATLFGQPAPMPGRVAPLERVVVAPSVAAPVERAVVAPTQGIAVVPPVHRRVVVPPVPSQASLPPAVVATVPSAPPVDSRRMGAASGGAAGPEAVAASRSVASRPALPGVRVTTSPVIPRRITGEPLPPLDEDH